MLKLDKKDKKILHQLEIDSMQSHASLAKKVGMSREVVSYRINRLEKEGIIDNYIVMLDPKKIGLEAYKWYLQLENTNSEKLKEIIGDLRKHEYCVWVNTCTGKYDIIVVFFASCPLHFKNITREFLIKYGKHIREASFTIEMDIYHFKKKFGDEKKSKSHEMPLMSEKTESIKLDEEEMLVLSVLCANPKKTLIDLAEESGLTIDKVRHRLQKLKKNGVLQGGQINVNNSKLGIESYKILLNRKIESAAKENQFLTYLSYNPKVLDVIHCLGNWDMEINIEVENSSKFHDVMMEIKSDFPDLIKNYELVQLFDNYKYTLFPMGTLQKRAVKLA